MRGIEQAVEALKAGRAVIFPTDTVYGLGVAVRYAASPRELYELKRRDAAKPIAWLVGSADDLELYGRDLPQGTLELARAHWPGALTLIVEASESVPSAYRSPANTIGLRMPASEIALALISEVGPLAASSANRSGKPAPRAFTDVAPDLLEAVAAAIGNDAVEGGLSASGTASTVIDCTQGKTTVVRQGDVALDAAPDAASDTEPGAAAENEKGDRTR